VRDHNGSRDSINKRVRYDAINKTNAAVCAGMQPLQHEDPIEDIVFPTHGKIILFWRQILSLWTQFGATWLIVSEIVFY